MTITPKKQWKRSNKITNLFQTEKQYPLVDRAIVIYVAVLLFFQILLQIAPVLTLLAKTPLYSIQSYLGLLGGFLLLVDLFTTKKVWHGKFCLLLYGILVLAALASLRTIGYGVKQNLFKLCWAAIQFALIYSCADRVDQQKFRVYVKRLFFTLLFIWLVACCVSLYQYVNQIGYLYVVNPLSQDASASRQGFYDNRLFGVFYTLNHAAYISLMFFLMGFFFAIKEKRLWCRVYLIVAQIILLSYIILSGSRSTAIAWIVCMAVIGWFLARNRLKLQSVKRSVACTAIALLVAVGCMMGYQAMRSGLSRLPYWKAMLVYHLQTDQHPFRPPMGTTEPTETIYPTGSGSEKPEPSTPQLPEKPNLDKDILDRDNLGEDFSNGRLSIWKDYLSLYESVGLVGMSPGNYMAYILEHYPDLYIVKYIQRYHPDKYASGIIYHPHNGYLMVYVSAGILGAMCLVVFMLLCMIRLVGLILRKKKLSLTYICAISMVVAGGISAMLDEGLFFQNNPHTTMFWLALGVVMSGCFLEEQKENGSKGPSESEVER